MASLVKDFEIIVPTIDEYSDKRDPKEYVMDISRQKAEAVYKHKKNMVISADTIVYFDNKILLKPTSYENAFSMLKKLSNNTHHVYTGICVIVNNEVINYCVETKIKFRNLSDNEIKEYIKSGRVYDKAGAYGIQETDFVLSIIGERENVIGLPIVKLKEILKKYGYERDYEKK